jgi:dihydroceramide fatty acyl 2-hydroxylase
MPDGLSPQALAQIVQSVPFAQPVLFALAGFASWSFIEYAIHGLMSHRFRTFVTPLHWGHHVEPRSVFTSPVAWIPTYVAASALVVWLVGPAIGLSAMLGVLLGFVRYERIHWRIHFRAPRSARERLRRSHHLAHHFVNPDAYHGVTTRFWDRIFGTLPAANAEDYARVAERPPLDGASNFRVSYDPRSALAHARDAAARR